MGAKTGGQGCHAPPPNPCHCLCPSVSVSALECEMPLCPVTGRGGGPSSELGGGWSSSLGWERFVSRAMMGGPSNSEPTNLSEWGDLDCGRQIDPPRSIVWDLVWAPHKESAPFLGGD